MLQELLITPSTVILIALIALGVLCAVRRMVRRGLCDCSDHCEGCSKASCTGCSAADAMVVHLEKHLSEEPSKP